MPSGFSEMVNMKMQHLMAQPFQTPPIQPAQLRPHPWPAYQMTAPAVDINGAESDRMDNGGVQSQIGSVPVIAGMADGAGTAVEGRNAVENEC
ncbi:hypothetical protein L208DRAFT_1390764 [Tricholoma matsutake]|nr:hypothetical protein L208DRAFT_1390764 [Tricholoma matsutake 945]